VRYRLLRFLTVLCVTDFATTAVSTSHAEERPIIRVFAAASLTEVALELARRFDAVRVEVSLGSSSALARQIRDGAVGDVFLAASPDWIDYLETASGLGGEPVVFARNQLVCVARRGSSLKAEALDPAALLEHLEAKGGVAIADEGVPAGEYTRGALRSLGLLDAYRPHLVGQKDVRAALYAVERGELSAGFVYATDAQLTDLEVLFAFDPATHPPIEYQAAVLRDAPHPSAARHFVDFLRGESARSLLVDTGFGLP